MSVENERRTSIVAKPIGPLIALAVSVGLAQSHAATLTILRGACAELVVSGTNMHYQCDNVLAMAEFSRANEMRFGIRLADNTGEGTITFIGNAKAAVSRGAVTKIPIKAVETTATQYGIGAAPMKNEVATGFCYYETHYRSESSAQFQCEAKTASGAYSWDFVMSNLVPPTTRTFKEP